MPDSSYAVLAPPRHTCLNSGGCCQGVHVKLLGAEEQDRIRRLGKELGVQSPIADGILRLEDGHCPFQLPDRLCAIHARFGFEAKPKVCRQYPVVATRTDDGIRVGVDPGCYTAVQTWRTGPLVGDEQLVVSPIALDDPQQRIEGMVLELLDTEGIDIAGVLCAITGCAPSRPGELPAGFPSRLITRLQAMDLPGLLALPDCSPEMRRALAPLVEALPGWDPASPPAWTSPGAEEEAYALQSTRLLVWLRLNHSIPTVLGATLLMLAGVVVVTWTHPETTAEFGRRLAAWVRALRALSFWTGLTPDAETMDWLARGDAAQR